ncbi:MAG TPA: hypothetical protein VHK00_01630 [Miltoncostaeaceae bacterium]|jgi:hypothetical protein|nr:hypothetical protein [Miltoncostaeaceae bacterium]
MRLPAGILVLAIAALAALPAAASAAPSLEPYRGLGTWIDIYDDPQLAAPERTVARIQARGVRTIFLETANFKQRADLVRADRLSRILDAAHARGIAVVAWYLPGFAAGGRDLRRSLAAIRFRSEGGEAFDSFALDIEWSGVTPVSLRNRRMLALSDRLRAEVGPDYALGAIIPNPRGMELRRDYWHPFPYAELAARYDVFVPMVYSTYRGDGPRVVTRDVTRSMTILRSATGRPDVPIHLIGGLGDEFSRAEARAFARNVATLGPIGWGLYDFSVTAPSAWAALRALG